MRWERIAADVKISERGSLSVLQALDSLPFSPVRLFWVTDVTPGLVRGFHAHKSGHQILFCIAGRIQVRFDDGVNSEVLSLTAGGPGAWMKNMVWGEQTFLETGSILLVVASNEYDESDYIRDWAEFRSLAKEIE